MADQDLGELFPARVGHRWGLDSRRNGESRVARRRRRWPPSLREARPSFSLPTEPGRREGGSETSTRRVPALNPFDLSGKVAIVTGGNGGIGLGIAKGLGDSGASVAIVGRNAEKSRAAAASLGQEALPVSADV